MMIIVMPLKHGHILTASQNKMWDKHFSDESMLSGQVFCDRRYDASIVRIVTPRLTNTSVARVGAIVCILRKIFDPPVSTKFGG